MTTEVSRPVRRLRPLPRPACASSPGARTRLVDEAIARAILGGSPAALGSPTRVGTRREEPRRHHEQNDPGSAAFGVGQTALSSKGGLEEDELTLACSPSRAIDDAGLSPTDVDGLALFDVEAKRRSRSPAISDWARSPSSPRSATAAARPAGRSATPRWRSRAVGATSPSPGARKRRRRARASGAGHPSGSTIPISGRGRRGSATGRRDRDAYPSLRTNTRDREQLANVALTLRRHANRNPRAAMCRKPSTSSSISRRGGSRTLCLTTTA